MIHYGMPFTEYKHLQGLNNSTLKTILDRSPMHAKWAQEHEREASDSQLLGSAFHSLILEPGNFSEQYYHQSIPKNLKAGKELAEANEGRIGLTNGIWQKIMAMKESLIKHPKYDEIFGSSTKEVTIQNTLNVGSVSLPVKCRYDFLDTHTGIRGDLKTTTNASPRGALYSVRDYRYHMQASWYGRLLFMEEIVRYGPFIFVFVETEPPFGVGIYTLSEKLMQEGHELCQAGLELYAYCQQFDEWPGYNENIEELG